MPDDPLVRPMRPQDVPAASATGWEAMREAGTRYGWHMPAYDAMARDRMELRVEHLRRTDPDGCWVAEDDGEVVGVALAMVRESSWFLSLLAVAAGLQGQGIGARLLQRSLETADGAAAAMIVASSDPKALRRYASAGFALHAGLAAVGAVDRSLLPAVPRVGEGDWDRDGERVDGLGRALRGAAYGPDLDAYRAVGSRLLVADEGFAVVKDSGELQVLGARDPRTAQDLLWAALAQARAEVEVNRLTGAQQWAVDVAVQARLNLQPGGAVCTRGAVGPLTPYLPGGAYG